MWSRVTETVEHLSILLSHQSTTAAMCCSYAVMLLSTLQAGDIDVECIW